MSNEADPLEKIADEAIREQVREVFSKAENGTPDNISKAGCLALAKKGKDVWNAWREAFPAWGEFFKWGNEVDFSAHDFRNDTIDFSGFAFGRNTNFRGALFDHHVDFKDAQFDGTADFQGTKFGKHTDFHGARFDGTADFQGAKFCNSAVFRDARFGNKANFQGVQFHLSADFKDAQFGNKANFTEVRFERFVDFNDSCFKGATTFARASFATAPTFHGCEFHQDTSFEGTEFPKASGDEAAARAYRTLKLAFSKQQAVREEQCFFRLEMAEETQRETGLKRWLFRAYAFFSDYGFSVVRPLQYGGLAMLALTMIYGLWSGLGQCVLGAGTCDFAPQWLEFSLIQALPLPGLEKLSEAASKTFWPDGPWWALLLSVLVITHKVISLAFLFLAGLALRNLFKMK